MQQAQPRESGERISWARALIFAVGFFFLATFLIGQLPSYINLESIASSLVGFEQAMWAFALLFLGAFLIIQAIVMLFDPKPVVPPLIFQGLGFIVGAAGLVLTVWASATGNQFFPGSGMSWNPMLGGEVLWFPAGSVDVVVLGVVMLLVGVAWLFYGVLAAREQSNPDRRDPGTTPAIRALITIGTVTLIVFMLLFAFVSPDGLAKVIMPGSCAVAINKGCSIFTGLFIVNTVYNFILAVAIFCTLGAFALRLHYLMRPVRKNTMSGLYMVGVNLAPIGLLCLVAWFAIYPFIFWLHNLPALGPFFTVCARKSAVPQSCGFSQEGGDLIGAILTTNGFVILMAAVWAWRTKRNLVVIGSVVIAAVLALATLVTHIESPAGYPYQTIIALLLTAAGLIMVSIWTSVARREFAVVGEKPLGCLGMWLVVGTCLFIYIASFGVFSLPGFSDPTEPNIPFAPGAIIGSKSQLDAIVVIVLIGILAAIQFYFLVRNRYRV
jgi:hypothetical protein